MQSQEVTSGAMWVSVSYSKLATSCSRTLTHAAQLSGWEPGFEPETFPSPRDTLYSLSYSRPRCYTVF